MRTPHHTMPATLGRALAVVAIGCALSQAGGVASASGMHHSSRLSAGPGSAAEAASADTLRTAMAHAPTAAAAGRVWLRLQARAIETRLTAGTTSPFPRVIDDLTSTGGFLAGAGDLTGDGGTDVLDARVTEVDHQFTLGVTARGGTTGRPLWTRTVGGADQFAFPLGFGRVGTPARRGLLVAQFSVSPPSSGTQSATETVQAWSGKDGSTLWTSAPVTGTVSISNGYETDTGVPTYPSPIHALAGGRADAFLPTETSTVSTRTGAGSGSATAVLVDGINGSSASPYPTVSATGSVPTLLPVPDLNGDGLADVLTLAGGHPGAVTAVTGNTGTVLWSDRMNVSGDALPFPVGRLSGGTAPDFEISGQSLRVLRGSDGKVVLYRGAGGPHSDGPPFAMPLGPAGPHRLQAVALLTETDIQTKSRFGTRFTFQAVTASDRVIWTRRVTDTLAITASSYGFASQVGPVGDVQPDGSTDFAVQIALSSGHHHATRAGIVSGRTGAYRAIPIGFGFPADGSLVRGRGTDFVDATQVSHGARLSGIDGDTGWVLFREVVPAYPGRNFTFATGIQATGHDCSDISLLVQTKQDLQDDVLSGGGARLWQLRYAEDQATGGRVTRYPAPRRFCAR